MLRIYYIFFILFSFNLYSQSINRFKTPDSLKNKSYEQLNNAYNKVFQIDNHAAELYANTILSKAKKEKNNDYLYDGYYKIAHSKGLKPEKGQPYADSLLVITKNIDTKEYPAKAYIIKGILLYKEFKYKKALDYYIKAQELSKNKNKAQYFYIKKLIGILKAATEENHDALSLFLEYYNYQKESLKSKESDIKSYIGSIFSVSNAYIKTKNYTQCKFYNRIGIAECKKYNDYSHYSYFIMSEGITDYYLKNYSNAKKNLLNTEAKLIKNEDHPNLAIIYYFLGKVYTETEDTEKAIPYFIKSDSLSLISNEFLPITRDGYEILIDYYKNKDDKENQLKFINKLFHADSITNSNKQYLSKEIYKKYDTPILLEEKEKLISDLSNKTSILFWCLGIGILIISFLIYKYIKSRRRIKDYQEQARLLMKRIEEPKVVISEVEEAVVNEEKSKSSLSDHRLQDLKIKLEQFESNKDFLRKNITVDGLAKDLKTNRDYLSKSVNELKGKNFSQYLNELRINYIIEELSINERLRKYTISAIADEVGFNTSESFSNAFKKITGTLPSFYIKILQDNNKKQNNDNQ